MLRLLNFMLLFIFTFLFLACQNKYDSKKISAPVVKKISRKDTILLVGMQFKEVHLLSGIKKMLSTYYQLPTKYIEAPLPQNAYYKPRERYKADSLLKYLALINNNKYLFVAGLTSKDISYKKGSIADYGIFGLGTLNAKGCVTSSFRLKKNASVSLLQARIQKVILHEIGHNHGLPHCQTPIPCFMKDAKGKIGTVDNYPFDVCKNCKIRLMQYKGS